MVFASRGALAIITNDRWSECVSVSVEKIDLINELNGFYLGSRDVPVVWGKTNF